MYDVTKLPKWAQQKISRLEADVAHYKNKLRQVGEGNTEVWVKDYLEGDQPLPRGTTITFKLANGEVDARVREGVLELYAIASRGFNRLAVMPRSSNLAWVTVLDEWYEEWYR